MSEKVVDYFYSMASPWTFLGHEPLVAMARKAGVAIRHKPVDMGAVFEVSGGLPLGKRPVQRRNYRLVELQRWRALRGVPLNLHPKFFPFDANAANRMVLAAQRQGGDANALAGAFMRAVWVEDRNMAEPNELIAAANACGLDGKALLAAADGTEAKADYAAATDEARKRGVFGAPTYIYRDEPFWGQDRLDFLERALAGKTEPVTLAKTEGAVLG